jgi:hypothetical protein
MECAGQVSQVTYRVPAGLITRVNGCYNDGATTYKFNMGELLILASGRALYTRKHCLDKAVNVGSIPTSPTTFVLITMCLKLIDDGPNC